MLIYPLSLNMGSFVLSNLGKDEGTGAAKEGSPTSPLLAQAAPSPGTPGTGSPPAPQPVTVPKVDRFLADTDKEIKKHNAKRARFARRIRVLKKKIARYKKQRRWGLIPGALRKQRDYESQHAERKILIWILSRNIGKARSASYLSGAVGDIRAATVITGNIWLQWRNSFWPAQLALILASELENRNIRKQLAAIIANRNRWKNRKGQVREKLARELIQRRLLRGRKRLALFQGENLFRLALLAKGLGRSGEYSNLLKQARASLENLVKQQEVSERDKYIPRLILRNKKELSKHIAWANLLMANILVQEAGALTKPAEILKKLREAKPYLAKTAAHKGIARLEVKKLEAAIQLRQGYIKKNQNDKTYLDLFKKAKKKLDYIIKWAEYYQKLIGTGVAPRWLETVVTSTRVTRAKADMVQVEKIRGRTKIETLRAQKSALVRIAGILTAALQKKYPYRRDTVPVIRFQERADLKAALSESLVLQAFIVKDLGDRAAYLRLLKQSVSMLKGILKQPASVLTRGIANFWLAKILSVRAGDTKSSQSRKRILKDAETFIQNALRSKKLRGPTLSSAYQTYGEILLLQKRLKKAKSMLKKALRIDPQNYEARTGLADTLNRMGKFRDAIRHYEELIKSASQHLLGEGAKLGKAEAEMRKGEKYLPTDIAELEKSALEIFAKEPPGSYLITRSIHGLIEAYGARKALQKRVILIANILLFGKKQPISTNTQKLANALAALRNRAPLGLRFTAELYLKLAEALSWAKKFGQAENLLKRIETDRKLDGIKKLIQGERELNLAYLLLKAELQMRGHKNTKPIMDPKLWQETMKSPDPDLITRLILGRMEGHFVKKDFQKASALAEQYLKPQNKTNLDKIKKIFKFRKLSFIKFKLKLWKNWTEALSWSRQYSAAIAELRNLIAEAQKHESLSPYIIRPIKVLARLSLTDVLSWDKQYRTAIAELKTLLSEAQQLAQSHPALSKFIKARAYLSLADNYRYLKVKSKAIRNYNYKMSIKYYNEAIKLFQQMKSSEARIKLGRAYFGLGEIYFYKKKYRIALNHYKTAITFLEPMNTKEARLYHAQAKLRLCDIYRFAKELRNPELARECYEEIDEIIKPVPKKNRERIRIQKEKSKGLFKLDRMLRNHNTIKAASETIWGSDKRVESRFDAEADITLGLILRAFKLNKAEKKHSWIRNIHFLFNQQIDLAGGTQIYTGYLGPHFLLLDSTLSISAQARFYKTDSGYRRMVFYRQAPLRAKLSYWHKWLILIGAAEIYLKDKERRLSTYHAAVRMNLDWAKSKWIKGLQPGLEYNYFDYMYMYQADSESDYFHPRHSLGVGARYQVDLTKWWRAQARFMWLFHATREKKAEDFWNWGTGFEVGIASRFKLGKYVELSLEFTHQNPDIWRFNKRRGKVRIDQTFPQQRYKINKGMVKLEVKF